MEPTLVFNHIPKCYGTSIKKYFRKFMTPIADYHAIFPDPPRFNEFPYDPSLFGAEDLLVGHFNRPGARLPERYPEVISNPRFHLFTFLREPLDMQISMYYYTLKKKKHIAEQNPVRFENLEGYLRKTYNAMAAALPCDESNYREVLSRYFFVGVTEKVATSMKVLIDRISKIYEEAEPTRGVLRMRRCLAVVRDVGLPHENKTNRDDQASKISAETLEIFKSRNALDYKLYEYALEQLEAATATAPATT